MSELEHSTEESAGDLKGAKLPDLIGQASSLHAQLQRAALHQSIPSSFVTAQSQAATYTCICVRMCVWFRSYFH